MPRASSPDAICFGAFTLDSRGRSLHKNGIRLKLHGQPFEILLLLLEHPGEVVTREELQKRLWSGDTFVDFENSLNAAIKKLRQALGDSAEKPRYIETIPSVGYRFLATVKTEIPEPNHPGIAASEPVEAKRSLPKRRLEAWAWRLTAAVVALGLAALGIGEWRVHRDASEPIQSLAVLPFQNLSGDPGQDYIAEGMTDELITDLAKIGSLRVISRTSALHFRNSKETLPQIARQLRVDAIVEGTVARSGEEVRVTAQLIQARDDRHLWADSYDRHWGDILTLQRQVAQAIVARIQVKITSEEQAALATAHPVNPQAYEDYLRGTDTRDELSEDSLMRSIQDFNQAIQIDPAYAQGYAGLSHSYYLLGVFGYRPSAEAYPKARALAEESLQLDSSNAEAYNTLADVKRGYEWDWAGAEADYKRAIALNPSYSNAHSEYALLLSMLGRHEQAVAEAEQNRELDPLAGETETLIGFVLYRARRYGEAVEHCRKGLAQDPDDPAGHWFLSLAYDATHQETDAVEEAQKAAELSPGDPFNLSKLGYAYGVAGEKAQAEKLLGQLAVLSNQRYVAPLDFGFVYLGLGDKESAMRFVNKAYQEHDNIEFLTFPAFDPLRSNAHFRALMQRVGLPE